MSTISFPSDRFPAPPAVSVDVPDTWEPVSVPAVVLAAKQSEVNADFTPNVIIRIGTRPEDDQPADALMELRGSVEARPEAQMGEIRTQQINGQEFHRVDVSWIDPQFGTIRQLHAFASLPREDSLQDFVHVTGSAGGAGLDTDVPVVEAVVASTRITR